MKKHNIHFSRYLFIGCYGFACVLSGFLFLVYLGAGFQNRENLSFGETAIHAFVPFFIPMFACLSLFLMNLYNCLSYPNPKHPGLEPKNNTKIQDIVVFLTVPFWILLLQFEICSYRNLFILLVSVVACFFCFMPYAIRIRNLQKGKTRKPFLKQAKEDKKRRQEIHTNSNNTKPGTKTSFSEPQTIQESEDPYLCESGEFYRPNYNKYNYDYEFEGRTGKEIQKQ